MVPLQPACWLVNMAPYLIFDGELQTCGNCADGCPGSVTADSAAGGPPLASTNQATAAAVTWSLAKHTAKKPQPAKGRRLLTT